MRKVDLYLGGMGGKVVEGAGLVVGLLVGLMVARGGAGGVVEEGGGGFGVIEVEVCGTGV